MKKLLIVLSMLFSLSLFAHSGHIESSFSFVMFEHYFTSLYHISVMLTVSLLFVVIAFFISKRKQIVKTMLMIVGSIGSMLSIMMLLFS